MPWGAVPSSPGGQCVPWGWPSEDRTHTPQTPPLSGLSPLRPSPECLSPGGAGGGKACSGFQSPARSRLRLHWGHSRQHLPGSSPLLSFGTLPLHRPAHPGPFSSQPQPLAPPPPPRGIPPTQHPQPEAPSVHLPSPRAGKARPAPLRNWPLEAQPGGRTTVVWTQRWAQSSLFLVPMSRPPPARRERIQWASNTANKNSISVFLRRRVRPMTAPEGRKGGPRETRRPPQPPWLCPPPSTSRKPEIIPQKRKRSKV